MKQVFLSGKGEIEVLDVPVPGRAANMILVKSAFSVISTGTEGAAVSRRGGWLGVAEKAAHSRDRVQQVWDLARIQGIGQTWDMVRNKLDDYIMPGYSCAGQVVEVGGESPYRPGDLVACFGAGFATHSEYVAMPSNLVAPIPAGVDCREAAFGAIACIAMQGVRRLELTPGETIGVIGLGLIGQIAAQLLTAMGYRAVGLDLSPARAAKAAELAGIVAWGSAEADSVSRVQELTGGRGLDGVIVCAASRSDGIINQAFDLCRRRGRVSLVGDVGLALQRAKMYQKELDLRMSTSYGPGRYDDEYELQGRDYPLAHVRWTEGRNLEHFLSLLQAKKLNLQPLMSHLCPIEDAAAGYARLKQGDQSTYGVLIDYGPLPENPQPLKREAYITRRATPVGQATSGVIQLGVIGCGGFAKAVHLPNLAKLPALFKIRGVATRSGGSAEVVARKSGADLATSDYKVLLEDSAINAVLISTRHASHARMVLDALEAGKHVFVEKPMCISVEEGKRIVEKAKTTGLIVRVGFNRRFAPYLNTMKKAVGTQGARIFTCRVNIGAIGSDWSNTPEEGGRLMGEGVHFFDLCNWFADSEPERITAIAAGDAKMTNPNVLLQIHYANGCAAQVLYTSLGHKGAGKEFFEAFGNGRAARCDDYKSVDISGAPAAKSKNGGKGHLEELEEFAAAIQNRPYPTIGADARAGLVATWMAAAAYQSAQENAPVLNTLED